MKNTATPQLLVLTGVQPGPTAGMKMADRHVLKGTVLTVGMRGHFQWRKAKPRLETLEVRSSGP